MKRSNWKLGTVAAMLVAASTFVSQAQAALVSLSYTPPSGVTTTGGAVNVDIVVSGLTEAMGGFSFLLDYSNLNFDAYMIDPVTMGPAPGDISSGDLGGSVDFFVFADGLITAPDLFAAQNSGGPFTIATVSFTGIADGPFTLGLRDVNLSNFDGSGTLCTGPGCVGTVPEPATALLLAAAALGGLALRRRKAQAA